MGTLAPGVIALRHAHSRHHPARVHRPLSVFHVKPGAVLLGSLFAAGPTFKPLHIAARHFSDGLASFRLEAEAFFGPIAERCPASTSLLPFCARGARLERRQGGWGR